MRITSLAFLLVVGPLACSPSSPASRVSGHFEDSEAAALEPFRFGQVVVPEYQPSAAVLVSSQMLVEHQQEGMMQELLKSGIDELWITVPHAYTEDAEQDDFKELYERLKEDRSKLKLLEQPKPGRQREWSRDYGPWMAKAKDGSRRLLEFNYYPSRASDDSVPAALAQSLNVPRLSLPIYIEGGNFMNNDSGACLMTDKVLEANAEVRVEGDLILDKDAIITYFKDFAGCKDVIIFPSMPYEGTRHLDLWAKFVDDQTILVSQIADEVLTLPEYSEDDLSRVREVRDYLDSRAAELQDKGFKIIRLPMPAPNFAEDGYNLFRSYTNSLLLNGHVFLPRYVRPANEADSVNGEYIDLRYVKAYEESVERIHRDLGFTVHWITSDSMIAKGGAVHCTTMQIAR